MFDTMDHQDWTPLKIGVGAAARSHTVSSAPTRTAVSHSVAVARKLESEDLPAPTKSLSGESRALIVKKRTEASQTQAQLNNACSFPANTIRDIESGKLCPTPTQLNVLNRVLKTQLKYA